jgi:uncharacterized protein (DUF1330 family)
MQVVNACYPKPEQILPFFGSPEDGAFVMVNLLKFKPRATYADGSDAHMSGAEAYARYGEAVARLVMKHGGRIIYSGAVTGLLLGECEQLWDMVALAEYPSLAAMLAMLASSDYQAIERHRAAGLEGQLNVRTKPMTAAK